MKNMMKTIAISTGIVCSVAAIGSAAEKPNVLCLIAEDISPDLGCYGTDLVKTPNLDQLAAQGVLFSNAFTTASVCSPSRSAFLTGMYQTSIDSHQHLNLNRKPLPDGLGLLSDQFRQNGYFVFNGQADDLSKAGKMDVNFTYDSSSIDGTDWRQTPEGKPFFGMIQFHQTHRDFARDPVNPIDPAKVVLPPYYPDHPLVRRDWADYLEDIQILDREVDRILKRLESDGVENTIVVFMGDHGRPMPRGKQFLYDGGIKIPLIIKWAGHLEPGSVNESLVSAIDIFPSCMALAGIDVPGNIHGRSFFGTDVKRREYIFAARDRCGEAADRIRCVRSKKYKYIRNFHPDRPYTQFSAYKEIQYPMLHVMRYLYQKNQLNAFQKAFMGPTRPYEELYNIESDPFELNNLATQSQYKEILAEMSRELDNWIIETNDAGQIPEDYKTEVDWYLRNQKWYATELVNRGMTDDDSPIRQVEYWTRRLMDNRGVE
jgi:uncharacterized sulfatase